MRKLLNIITIVGTLFVLLCGVYFFLPPETQEQILGEISAVGVSISGVSVGSAVAIINYALRRTDKTEERTTNQVMQVLEKFLTIKDNHTELNTTQKGFNTKLDQYGIKIKNLENSIARLIKLFETNLQAKASNPLIEKETKRIIDSVLVGDNDENE